MQSRRAKYWFLTFFCLPAIFLFSILIKNSFAVLAEAQYVTIGRIGTNPNDPLNKICIDTVFDALNSCDPDANNNTPEIPNSPPNSPFMVRAIVYNPFPVGTYPLNNIVVSTAKRQNLYRTGHCQTCTVSNPCTYPDNGVAMSPFPADLPVPVAGDNIVCTGEGSATPSLAAPYSIFDRSDVNLTRDLQNIKNLGFNTIRTLEKVSPALLTAAYNAGLYVIAGFPVPQVFDFHQDGAIFRDLDLNYIKRFTPLNFTYPPTSCSNGTTDCQRYYTIIAFALGNGKNYDLWQPVTPPGGSPACYVPNPIGGTPKPNSVLGNEVVAWYSKVKLWIQTSIMQYQFNKVQKRGRPTVIVNDGIYEIGNATYAASDADFSTPSFACPPAQTTNGRCIIWGVNAYVGQDFDNLFDDFNNFNTNTADDQSDFPLLITGFGADAFMSSYEFDNDGSCASGTVVPDGPWCGTYDLESQQNQALWMTAAWDDVFDNFVASKTIGGVFDEYSDESWKPDTVYKNVNPNCNSSCDNSESCDPTGSCIPGTTAGSCCCKCDFNPATCNPNAGCTPGTTAGSCCCCVFDDKTPNSHDTNGLCPSIDGVNPPAPPFDPSLSEPDGFHNAEWFGFYEVDNNGTGADDLTPRPVADGVDNTFDCNADTTPPLDYYYAGPENNKNCNNDDPPGGGECCPTRGHQHDTRSINPSCVQKVSGACCPIDDGIAPSEAQYYKGPETNIAEYKTPPVMTSCDGTVNCCFLAAEVVRDGNCQNQCCLGIEFYRGWQNGQNCIDNNPPPPIGTGNGEGVCCSIAAHKHDERNINPDCVQNCCQVDDGIAPPEAQYYKGPENSPRKDCNSDNSTACCTTAGESSDGRQAIGNPECVDTCCPVDNAVGPPESQYYKGWQNSQNCFDQTSAGGSSCCTLAAHKHDNRNGPGDPNNPACVQDCCVAPNEKYAGPENSFDCSGDGSSNTHKCCSSASPGRWADTRYPTFCPQDCCTSSQTYSGPESLPTSRDCDQDGSPNTHKCCANSSPGRWADARYPSFCPQLCCTAGTYYKGPENGGNCDDGNSATGQIGCCPNSGDVWDEATQTCKSSCCPWPLNPSCDASPQQCCAKASYEDVQNNQCQDLCCPVGATYLGSQVSGTLCAGTTTVNSGKCCNSPVNYNSDRVQQVFGQPVGTTQCQQGCCGGGAYYVGIENPASVCGNTSPNFFNCCPNSWEVYQTGGAPFCQDRCCPGGSSQYRGNQNANPGVTTCNDSNGAAFNHPTQGTCCVQSNGKAAYDTLTGTVNCQTIPCCPVGQVYSGPGIRSCGGNGSTDKDMDGDIDSWDNSACCPSAMWVKNGQCTNSCGGGSGCFLSDTLVSMADGTKKPIQDMQVGDMVMAYDENTKQMKPDKVTEIFRHEKEDVYMIINGKLKVTPIHRVLSKGEWVEIGTLQVGDMLTSSKGKDVRIDSIEVVNETVPIYNFEVNPLHTYTVGMGDDEIIVHNRKALVTIPCQGPEPCSPAP